MNIIQNNYLNEQSLKKLSDALNLIIYQTNVEKSTFNKLFNLIINNNQLIEQLSTCLSSSLILRDEEYIEEIISENISNLEYLIENNFINEHIIQIIKSVPSDFYKTIGKSKLYYFYLFDEYLNKN